MARMYHELRSAAALGDPAMAARAVLTVAAMAEPPLRLILGSKANAYAARPRPRRTYKHELALADPGAFRTVSQAVIVTSGTAAASTNDGRAGLRARYPSSTT